MGSWGPFLQLGNLALPPGKWRMELDFVLVLQFGILAVFPGKWEMELNFVRVLQLGKPDSVYWEIGNRTELCPGSPA